MKLNLFSLSFFFIFFLSSFHKDHADNYFTVGNKTYPLHFCEIANESYGKSKFEIDLSHEDKDVTKAKTCVYFSLASNNTSTLSNGIYQFSSATLQQRLPFQFNGFVRANNHAVEITRGTIAVENHSGNADIQFILQLQNGDIAKGIFRGKASEANRSQTYD